VNRCGLDRSVYGAGAARAAAAEVPVEEAVLGVVTAAGRTVFVAASACDVQRAIAVHSDVRLERRHEPYFLTQLASPTSWRAMSATLRASRPVRPPTHVYHRTSPFPDTSALGCGRILAACQPTVPVANAINAAAAMHGVKGMEWTCAELSSGAARWARSWLGFSTGR
jgi:hypothetical protein